MGSKKTKKTKHVHQLLDSVFIRAVRFVKLEVKINKCEGFFFPVTNFNRSLGQHFDLMWKIGGKVGGNYVKCRSSIFDDRTERSSQRKREKEVSDA